MAKNSTFVATLKFIDAFTPGFSKAIAEAERANQKFFNITRSMSNLGGALQRTGAVMTATVTAPIVMLGKKAMDSASSYEGALNQIMTLQRKFVANGDIDLSDPNALNVFKSNVDKQITEMSKSYGIAQTSLAQSYRILASAFNDTSHMQEAMEVSNKMAIVGQVEAGDSARLLATLYNAYGDEMYNSISRVGDIMTSAVMFGFTEFPELASVMGQVTQPAAQAGISIEDLATSLAVITSTGLSTAESVTYFKRAIQDITKNGDRWKITDDHFLQYLNEIKAEAPEVEDIMKRFKNIRSSSAMTSLSAKTDLFEIYHDEIKNAQGTLDESYEAIAGSSSHSMKQSMMSIEAILIRIGQRVLPTVSNVMEKVADRLDKLSDEDLDKLVSGLVGLAAAGPVMSTTGTVIKTLSQIIEGAGKLFLGKKVFEEVAKGGIKEVAKGGIKEVAKGGFDVIKSKFITLLEGLKGTLPFLGKFVAPAVIGTGLGMKASELKMGDDTLFGKDGPIYYSDDFDAMMDQMSSSARDRYNNALLGRNASGTSRWKGGLTSINENGGEIVDLPTGSRIYPHNQSMKMGGLTINIPKFADTITIRDDKDIDVFAEAFADKLMKVVANS